MDGLSVAHETRILAECLGLTRIVRSRNVSPVSWQSRQFSIGLVVLASSRLSRQRSGCYGAAAVVSGGGGTARDLKGLQGAARGWDCEGDPAAPTYFKPALVGGKFYVDGGVLCNNPAGQALNEAETFFPKATHEVALLLSVGCGEVATDDDDLEEEPPRRHSFLRRAINIIKSCATDTADAKTIQQAIRARKRASKSLIAEFPFD
jgi:hypothetical protein